MNSLVYFVESAEGLPVSGGGHKKGRSLKAFVALGIPSHAVEVIVHEIQKSDWGVGEKPVSAKSKDRAR